MPTHVQPRRLVFLGDSITDGHTLILHVEQALTAAGDPSICFNAGTSGDRADQMLARIPRDVLAQRPDLVLVSAGINDAMQGIAPETYRGNLAGIITSLRGAGVDVILLTLTPLAAEHAAARLLSRAYGAIQRELARAHGLLLAEVSAAMAAAQATGASRLLAADGIHLDEPGYCAMAAAVLAALGHADAAIPPRPRWEPLPGLITRWRIAAGDQHGVLTVPEPGTAPAWWDCQERARGYAQSFTTRLPGSTWTATAELPPGPALTVSLGGQVRSLAVDGQTLYDAPAFRGWHVRAVADLPASPRVRHLQLAVTGSFVVGAVPAQLPGA